MPRAADMLSYRTPQQFGAGQTIDRSVPMATPTGEFIPTPPTESQTQWEGALSNPSVANILYGAGETAASVLSSPLPYVAGMVGYGYGALTGKDPRETGAQFQQATTLEPKTALGQYYTEQASDKLGALPPVISGIPTPRIGAGATRYAGQQYGMPMLEKSLTMYEQGKLTPGFTPISQLEAWHGTPHEIKGNFDLAKVGTGEGAQAFGEGMYFAQARGTGEEYARILANRMPENQGRLNAHANAQRLVSLAGDPKYAADDIKFVLESNPNHDQKKLLESTLKYVESGDYAKPLENKGNLYKVDIPDEQIPRMMDWDKPISQQQNVTDSLRNLAKSKVEEKLLVDLENEIAATGKFASPVANSSDYMTQLFSDANGINRQEIQNLAKQKLASMDLTKLIDKEYNNLKPKDMNWDMTGKEFYENLSKTLGSPKKASEALSSYGVSGIRYLDAVSRNSDQKTSNFVVFQPETVKILEKNDKPIDIFSILYK